MSITFDAPSYGGESIRPADVEGHLLIVEPHEFISNMPTSMGETDAIQVTVHDITEGSSHENQLWFSRVLVGSLKNRLGSRVLGVMGKGEAKAGQTAPWILVDASKDEKSVAAASEYLLNATKGSINSLSQDDLVEKLQATVIKK